MNINSILIAPDSFKGSLTAREVTSAISDGIQQVQPESTIIQQPLADGGEGTFDCIINSLGGYFQKEIVIGPLGGTVNAEYGILADRETAIIEMAAIAGLNLVPNDKRNPLFTTSYGVGELIRKIVEKEIKTIFLGLGGSATVDAGVGALQALGVNVLDAENNNISLGGKFLDYIQKIELAGIREKYKNIKLKLLCDVNNPLTGKNGAARVYAPQKGADPVATKLLEENLEHFAEIVQTSLKRDISNIPGAGAAGGLGAGLSLIFPTEFLSGSKHIIEITELAEKIKNCDLIITGEGELNSQTAYGKIPYEVAKLAHKYNKKVIGIFGKMAEDLPDKKIFDEIHTLVNAKTSLEEALKNSYKLLKNKSKEVIGRLI